MARWRFSSPTSFRDADDDHEPARPCEFNGQVHRRKDPDAFESDIDSAASCKFADRLDGILKLGVDNGGRSKLACQRGPARELLDYVHVPHACRTRCGDGTEADRSGADDNDVVTDSNTRQLHRAQRHRKRFDQRADFIRDGAWEE
jgi:hypothetical protein